MFLNFRALFSACFKEKESFQHDKSESQNVYGEPEKSVINPCLVVMSKEDMVISSTYVKDVCHLEMGNVLTSRRIHQQISDILPKDYLNNPFYKVKQYCISKHKLADILFETFIKLNQLCDILETEKIVYFRTMTILYQVLFKNTSDEKLNLIKNYHLFSIVGASFALAYCLDDDEDINKYDIWEVLPKFVGYQNAKQLEQPIGQIWALLDFDLYAVEDIYERYIKYLYKFHTAEQIQKFTAYLSLIRISPDLLRFDSDILLFSLDHCLFSKRQIPTSSSEYAECYFMVKELVHLFPLAPSKFSYVHQSFDLSGGMGKSLNAYLHQVCMSEGYVFVDAPDPQNVKEPERQEVDLNDFISDSSGDESIDLQCHWNILP